MCDVNLMMISTIVMINIMLIMPSHYVKLPEGQQL